MRICATLLSLVMLVWLLADSRGQETPLLTAFDGVVAFTGYPNGLLFHTAFHGNKTTRFLLIKAIASVDRLAKEFALSAEQIAAINELQPINTASSNDAPDELLVDPKIYEMLTPQQLDVLTFLTLHFDGLPGLTQKSTADRIGISATTFKQMREIVSRNRESVVMPNFRVRFASNPSENDKAKNADFDTRLIVMTNFQLVAILNDNERAKLTEFVKAHQNSAIVQQIAELAPLPDGLSHLHEFAKENNGRTKP